jgi:hypothetical protein
MTPLSKGLVIAVVQVSLVASLGAKLLYDRATLPRVWVKVAPYDPNLPIRGRYVSLQLVVEPYGTKDSDSTSGRTVALRVENDRLLAVKQENVSHSSSDLRVRYSTITGEKVAVLSPSVAFFIPEHIPDPSRRAHGEQLWVEATIPKKGPPRPIRLGVTKDSGPITPLDIQ